jgi:rubrerythrin
MLTGEEQLRARVALEVWFTNPGDDYRAPGVEYDQDDLEHMHAALAASTVDAALVAFGAEPGTWMTTTEQATRNREIMTAIHQRRDELAESMVGELRVRAGLRWVCRCGTQVPRAFQRCPTCRAVQARQADPPLPQRH